jgi:hypothetical protein
MFCHDASYSNEEMALGTAVREIRDAHSRQTEDSGSNITSDILRILFEEECQRRSWIVGKVHPDVSKHRNVLR